MSLARLTQCRHWVFDMDGTLTVGVHDFQYIRRALDIPPDRDILEYLEALPDSRREASHAWLMAHERQLALGATAARGAKALIRALRVRGDHLGILTRNARELAHTTLQAIELSDVFAIENVLGRECAPPKPHPGGLEHFFIRWDIEPARVIMVGDSPLDMQCGRAAGAGTLLINTPENPCPEAVDHHLDDCEALLTALQLG
ncbi:HAD family hydrolase [Larsenimonas suaedae]|uniref:HAD family hydrolase n=1 Tax=Larsenimonas suaedae TaxID=1851019 RepID=A0ABU1GYG3_9GAMM|nr:HAD family hydrolase [Larsenimonas suaedae]MCM2972910.1 HAD family hydrolase [Larsenimonas suaedae]MDR5897009.1 HAD family hydrolase [Larsenimonas suaedae]